jgi:serine phosphatase RsbU (regulator of sigma subunit)
MAGATTVIGDSPAPAGILADVEEFSRGAHQADDITLLVVRYLGHRSG